MQQRIKNSPTSLPKSKYMGPQKYSPNVKTNKEEIKQPFVNERKKIIRKYVRSKLLLVVVAVTITQSHQCCLAVKLSMKCKSECSRYCIQRTTQQLALKKNAKQYVEKQCILLTVTNTCFATYEDNQTTND